MFSQPTQSQMVQARIEDLHRVARTSNRAAVPMSTLVKRALSRVFDVGRAGNDGVVTIPGVQFVGHPSTTSWSRRS